MSYEKMYEHYMKLDFRLDYSKDEEFMKLIEMDRNLYDLKQKFSSRVYNEIKEDPKYKGIIEKKAEHLATTSYVLATAYYIVSYIIKVRMFMRAL